jgi:hypothetical protein
MNYSDGRSPDAIHEDIDRRVTHLEADNANVARRLNKIAPEWDVFNPNARVEPFAPDPSAELLRRVHKTLGTPEGAAIEVHAAAVVSNAAHLLSRLREVKTERDKAQADANNARLECDRVKLRNVGLTESTRRAWESNQRLDTELRKLKTEQRTDAPNIDATLMRASNKRLADKLEAQTADFRRVLQQRDEKDTQLRAMRAEASRHKTSLDAVVVQRNAAYDREMTLAQKCDAYHREVSSLKDTVRAGQDTGWTTRTSVRTGGVDMRVQTREVPPNPLLKAPGNG